MNEQGNLPRARQDRDAYEEGLPKRPRWVWFCALLLIPISGILLYTQIVSDVASFAAQGRAPQVAVVLGMALAVGLMAIPLYVRIRLSSAESAMFKGLWLAILVMGVVAMIGLAMMVAGSRGEAQFAEDIRTAISEISYYESRGNGYEAAVDAAVANLEDLKIRRDAVVDQDRTFAAVFSGMAAIVGWLDLEAMLAVGLVARRWRVAWLEQKLIRANNAISRLERVIQQAIVLAAREAGVLDHLQPAAATAGARVIRALPGPPEPPTPPDPGPTSGSGQPPTDGPTHPGPSPTTEANPGQAPSGSTTSLDDNL